MAGDVPSNTINLLRITHSKHNHKKQNEKEIKPNKYMMDAKTLVVLVLPLFLAYYGNAQPAVFDITKYGAVAGGDISEV